MDKRVLWALGILAAGGATLAVGGAIRGDAPSGGGPLLAVVVSVGSVTQPMPGSPSAGFELKKADGRLLQVVVDPQETVILQGGRVARTNRLEPGQNVKVRHLLKDGRAVARTIEILDPLPMPPVEQSPLKPDRAGG